MRFLPALLFALFLLLPAPTLLGHVVGREPLQLAFRLRFLYRANLRRK